MEFCELADSYCDKCYMNSKNERVCKISKKGKNRIKTMVKCPRSSS
jgi:hypothetical protein